MISALAGMWRQIEANSLHVAVLKRIFVDRNAAHAEVTRRIDVGAAVVRHGEEHHAIAVHVSGFDEGLFVGLPDAVDDRRLSRIGRGAVIELPAQVDHSHGSLLPVIFGAAGDHRVVADCPRDQRLNLRPRHAGLDPAIHPVRKRFLRRSWTRGSSPRVTGGICDAPVSISKFPPTVAFRLQPAPRFRGLLRFARFAIRITGAANGGSDLALALARACRCRGSADHYHCRRRSGASPCQVQARSCPSARDPRSQLPSALCRDRGRRQIRPRAARGQRG